MSFTSPRPESLAQQAALGTLLSEAVAGVVQAQQRLDDDAVNRATQYVSTPQGELTLPPLWYTFSAVQLQLELAATLTRTGSGAGSGVRFDCRLLNPAAVSLFGYTAASGFKVALTLAPREAGADAGWLARAETSTVPAS